MSRGVRAEFDPKLVSPNRINQYVSCGQAFKMNYIDRIPEEASGSAALFGVVMHKALETWAMDRSKDLLALVEEAWRTETAGTPVLDFIFAYQALSKDIIRAEYECAQKFKADNKGRETKAVRMTGHWKRHPAAKRLGDFNKKWLPKLEGSPWKFRDNDPLTGLYNESLVLARRYEARQGGLPNAWHAEFGFKVPFRDFILNGYIDSIEPIIDADGVLKAIGIVDYKTYRYAPSPQKDWRQRVFYYIAVQYLLVKEQLDLPASKGLPVYVGMDYIRWTDSWLADSEEKYGYRCTDRVWQEVTPADIEQLAVELEMYERAVSAGVFLPAEKGKNVDFCGYPSNCCLRTKGEGCGGVVTP